ncbi:MAG: zinc ribbon domain-containing protein [Patescibacteria group bacterium]|nr:zinc ribbon domain-containing protein [Patescibacteria group bacterium]
MPLYLFECNKCYHQFEEQQSIKDTNPPCPECGDETKKLINFQGRVNGNCASPNS